MNVKPRNTCGERVVNLSGQKLATVGGLGREVPTRASLPFYLPCYLPSGYGIIEV